MPDGLRLLIYSPCAAVLAGIESALSHRPGDDGYGSGGLHLARVRDLGFLAASATEFRPDVTILHSPNRRCLAAAGRVPPPVVLAVGDDLRGADIVRAVRSGTVTLVSVDSDLAAIGPACICAIRGLPYLSPSLVYAMVIHLAGRDGAAASTALRLTAREAQILRHLAIGRSQADTAAALRITGRTVKYHLGNAYRKLGVHSQIEAIAIAYQEGLAP